MSPYHAIACRNASLSRFSLSAVTSLAGESVYRQSLSSPSHFWILPSSVSSRVFINSVWPKGPSRIYEISFRIPINSLGQFDFFKELGLRPMQLVANTAREQVLRTFVSSCGGSSTSLYFRFASANPLTSFSLSRTRSCHAFDLLNLGYRSPSPPCSRLSDHLFASSNLPRSRLHKDQSEGRHPISPPLAP